MESIERWINFKNWNIRVVVNNAELLKAKRPLLLIHGAGVASEATWSGLTTVWKTNQPLIMMDLPLHGQSRSEAQNSMDMFELSGLMDEICFQLSVTECDIVGYSLGALIALRVLSNSSISIKRAVLIEPPGLAGSELQLRQNIKDIVTLEGKSVAEFLTYIAPESNQFSTKMEALMVERLEQNKVGLQASIVLIRQFLEQFLKNENWINDLPDIGIDLILGQKSQTEYLVTMQKLAEQAGWQCHIIPGADHTLPFQKPRRIAMILEH